MPSRKAPAAAKKPNQPGAAVSKPAKSPVKVPAKASGKAPADAAPDALAEVPAKPSRKAAAEPAKAPKPAKSAKPAAKDTVKKKAAKAAVPVVAPEAADATPPAAPPAAPRPPKQKLVRDSFTIPRGEYQLLDTLKQRLVSLMQPAKKSELLRAGIKLLASLPDDALRAALSEVPAIKTGRPGKS